MSLKVKTLSQKRNGKRKIENIFRGKKGGVFFLNTMLICKVLSHKMSFVRACADPTPYEKRRYD